MSILLETLSKRFGSTPIVDQVSLEIMDGELFVLLGASGSGKSTLLRMIAGLLPVDEGQIYLHGREVTTLPPQQRHVGFVFQNYSLFRHMSVAENIEFGLDIRGVPKAKRAAKRDELLELIGLAGLGARYPRQLSGGQQQRVAVARALAFEPSVLLLDEPFGALDVKIRVQLRQTLKRLQRHLNVTTILVTHDQEEAFELADRIGVLEHGRLLEVGAPTELYRHPRHEFVAHFVGSATLLEGRWEEGALHLGSLLLPAPDKPAQLSSSGRVAVLLRPEDLVLAGQRDQLALPVLGQGMVEEVHFLGTLQRLLVRLPPLPGIRSLLTDYGKQGLLVQVAQLSEARHGRAFEVGQSVWVGIQTFHLMPRLAPHMLLCLDESSDASFINRLGEVLGQITEGPVTVLALAEGAGRARQLLATARESIGSHLPTVTFKSRTGPSADLILREVVEGHYDVVLIRAKPSRPDTLAEQLTQRLPIPLLVIKGERAALERILLCTAGGEPGKQDILFGGRLARRAGAIATLLHVTPPDAALEGAAPNGVTRHLEQGAQTLQQQGVRAEVKLRQGVVLHEILAEASEGNHDVVVVGGHLNSAPLPFLEHDLATEIVRLADRPVLVVRGGLA